MSAHGGYSDEGCISPYTLCSLHGSDAGPEVQVDIAVLEDFIRRTSTGATRPSSAGGLSGHGAQCERDVWPHLGQCDALHVTKSLSAPSSAAPEEACAANRWLPPISVATPACKGTFIAQDDDAAANPRSSWPTAHTVKHKPAVPLPPHPPTAVLPHYRPHGKLAADGDIVCQGRGLTEQGALHAARAMQLGSAQQLVHTVSGDPWHDGQTQVREPLLLSAGRPFWAPLQDACSGSMQQHGGKRDDSHDADRLPAAGTWLHCGFGALVTRVSRLGSLQSRSGAAMSIREQQPFEEDDNVWHIAAVRSDSEAGPIRLRSQETISEGLCMVDFDPFAAAPTHALQHGASHAQVGSVPAFVSSEPSRDSNQSGRSHETSGAKSGPCGHPPLPMLHHRDSMSQALFADFNRSGHLKGSHQMTTATSSP